MTTLCILPVLVVTCVLLNSTQQDVENQYDVNFSHCRNVKIQNVKSQKWVFQMLSLTTIRPNLLPVPEILCNWMDGCIFGLH